MELSLAIKLKSGSGGEENYWWEFGKVVGRAAKENRLTDE
jgi:hypothetical protein